MLKNYTPEISTLSKAICLVCGGGRKNKYLIEILRKNLNIEKLVSIDEYGHDGDYIESEAFAYLAIRSYLKLPISFPSTTGCKEPSTGGIIVKNY
jgi:anhydro-N-acetylmuramic acid kinase